jgi:hypothetical protein
VADFNAGGVAALDAQVVNVRWMAWLDIAGDVQRITTAPFPLTFSGTGDPDLDGFTFGHTGALIDVSEVTHRAGGSDTVTAFLSGLSSIDTTTLNQIGNPANWQGRSARLWLVILNPDTDALIAVAPYYQGFMSTPRITGSAATQTISLDIEGFLASYSEPSGRTYLDALEFDAGDNSAAATLAAANGTAGAKDGRDISLSGLFGALVQSAIDKVRTK